MHNDYEYDIEIDGRTIAEYEAEQDYLNWLASLAAEPEEALDERAAQAHHEWALGAFGAEFVTGECAACAQGLFHEHGRAA